MNIENEVFQYAKKYIQDNSKYNPYVYPTYVQTSKKFPLIIIKQTNDLLHDECLAKEEQKFRVTFEIEIYAENQPTTSRKLIIDELKELVNDVFDVHFGMSRRISRDLPNEDMNIDRHFLRYAAIVDENKRIFRRY